MGVLEKSCQIQIYQSVQRGDMCISRESEEIDEALLERSATDVRGASTLVRLTVIFSSAEIVLIY